LAFGSWQKIWPVFGSSNQLVAGIVLLVCSCYLMMRGKNPIPTLIGSIFMFLTTMTALTISMVNFYKNKNFLLGNISLILILLSIFMINEGIKILKSKAKKAPE
ncbi:MAG: carbon starvation CstA family protein, partial [Elusimicrobiales bacterium]